MKSHDRNKKPGTGELAKEGIPETAPRVIVVEGDPSRAADLAETVRKLGYGIVAAVADGTEALRISGMNPPDIAIVDLTLAGTVDGPTLAGQLDPQRDIGNPDRAGNQQNLFAAVKATRPCGYLPRPSGEREVGIAIAVAASRRTVDLASLTSEAPQKKHRVHLEAVIARENGRPEKGQRPSPPPPLLYRTYRSKARRGLARNGYSSWSRVLRAPMKGLSRQTLK